MASSSLLPLALCLCLFLCCSSARHTDYHPDDLTSDARLLRLFDRWILHHSKNYTSADGSSQKLSRFHTFKHNLFYIHQHNQLRPAAHRLGLNRFADLTHHEFASQHLGFRPRLDSASNRLRQYGPTCDANSLPKSVDWRVHGAVTRVKNQGQCGSCWAFSTTGAIEGAHAIATGELVSLSEQELVSCAHSNYGCNGGLMDPAFEWVVKNGGINTEKGYPYQSAKGRSKFCKLLLKWQKAVTIDGYEDVLPNDETALMCAVSRQPVSVAINAGAYDFQLYADGVFSGACSDDPNDIDHAVLVVGYGSDKGKDYWIVKNSWSEDWGLDGYVHIERSTGNKRGVCGIHSFPSYPVTTAGSTSLSASM